MTPQPQVQFDVFLSYSSDDVASVLVVEQALEKQGLRVWRDGRQIAAGESFIQKIQAGLSQSRCVVLFNSHKALASTWVQREWNVALTVNMRIIPVRLDDSEVPLLLKPEEFIDLRDSSRLEFAVRQIAEGIRGVAVAPPVSPQSSSNPSVLGKDVMVIERMIATQHRAGRRLAVARWAAAVAGVAVAAGVIILVGGTLGSWVAVAAAGPLLIAGAIVWAVTAQLGLSQSEMNRLNGIKDGIELYCPNQAACADFRVRLEAILKKLAGIGEGA
jgi:hypothetical protein